MGDEAFFRSLLICFRDSQRNFAQDFRAACTGTDTTAPERLAHTLKGAAGTIGAWQLHASAGELEEACAKNASATQTGPLLDRTTVDLDLVIAGLNILGSAQKGLQETVCRLRPLIRRRYAH